MHLHVGFPPIFLDNGQMGMRERDVVQDKHIADSLSYPYFKLAIISCASLSSAVALTSLFPYVGFMVVDFGLVSNVNEAGYYSGYIAAAMMTGRLFSSYYWGRLADHIGRRPVMCCGCASILVISLLFGFSVRFWMAMAARFLLGLTNPLVGLVKVVTAEVCTEKQMALAMSLSTGAYSVGMLLGPAVGGLLARPAVLYPHLFPTDSLWGRFPYLLPNIVVSGLAAVSLVLVYSFLPETLVKNKDIEATSSNRDSPRGDQIENSSLFCVACDVQTVKNAVSEVYDLLLIPGVFRSLTAYFMISLFSIIFDEILPLWLLTTADKGGLNCSSKAVGQILVFMSGPMMLFAFVGYPLIAKRLPTITCFYTGQTVAFICAFAISSVPTVIPIAAQTVSGSEGIRFSWTLFTVIVIAAIVKMGTSLTFTSVSILINNTVQSAQRGSVNGLAMTVGSTAKSVGPIVGSTMYAWSINNGLSTFPLNYCFSFVVLFVLGIGAISIRVAQVDERSKALDTNASAAATKSDRENYAADVEMQTLIIDRMQEEEPAAVSPISTEDDAEETTTLLSGKDSSAKLSSHATT
jgi:MFS family permease